MSRIKPYRFEGVYAYEQYLLTRNLVRGISVYGEELIVDDNDEYRVWNPKRSKVSAMLKKNCRNFPFKADSKILYLGAASGTTASHISDIASDGIIYAVEFSPRSFRGLIKLSEDRKNLIPILADARHPERYRHLVGNVDVVYQDISQKDQVGIFIKNLNQFLSSGYGIIMVKSRSLDVSARPKEMFRKVENGLRDEGLNILESINLAPFQKDHSAIVVMK